MKRGNPAAIRASLFEVIENQIRANDPPEARETLDRLVREGHTREASMKLIGCALVSEIHDVLKSEAPYSNARYVANLERLPELPWGDDE